MNSIVFFTNKNEWKPEAWVTVMGGTISETGQFIVEALDSWISIYKYDDVFNDYDEDEEQLVRSFIHDPIPYLVEWRGDELLQKFIDDFPFDKHAVIDNDHGLICNISELKGKPASDWVFERKLKN